jgi:hypothetical protein
VSSMPCPGTARGDHAASPPVRASVMCTPSATKVDASERTGGTGRRSQRVQTGKPRGYDGHMGILILILVVLAIIALVIYIARRSRV